MSDQDDWVRRMLAETGDSAEPMPAEVADRLDRVLEGLADSRQPDDPPAAGAVVPMTRRRHRRWGTALLAAAAITVGGYTLTATGVLDDLTGGGAGAQSASDSAAGVEPESAADELAGAGATGPQLRRLPSVSSDTLRRDAAALAAAAAGADVASLRAAQAQGKTGDGTRDEPGEAGAPATTRASCVAPPAGVRGTRLPVAYDGERATAVVRTGAAGRTVVEVWSCDAPVRHARVAVRR